MRGTFFNAGSSLSIGIFFSLMVTGLAATLPATLSGGLRLHGVPAAVATQVSMLPPVGTLFAAFLGYNPIAALLTPSGVLARLPQPDAAALTGHTFFPRLISGPFHHGLVVVFPRRCHHDGGGRRGLGVHRWPPAPTARRSEPPKNAAPPAADDRPTGRRPVRAAARRGPSTFAEEAR